MIIADIFHRTDNNWTIIIITTMLILLNADNTYCLHTWSNIILILSADAQITHVLIQNIKFMHSHNKTLVFPILSKVNSVPHMYKSNQNMPGKR